MNHPKLLDSGFHHVGHCRHGLMLYNTRDPYVGRSLEKYGEYREEEVSLFRQILHPRDFVLDIGANIGAHTLFIAGMVGRQGRVYALEHRRLIFQSLCANMALNEVTNTVCLWAAAGARPGRVNVPTLAPGISSHVEGFNLEDTPSSDSVSRITIDGLALSSCRLIRIDVEGTEIEVLEGARETLARHGPVLYLEIDHREKSDELIRWVIQRGYTPYWHTSPLFQPNNYYQESEDVFGGMKSFNLLCLLPHHKFGLEGLQRIEPQQKMRTTGSSESFAAAVSFHEAGAFAQAASLYRQLLEENPRQVELWCRLGDVCRALGNAREAGECYQQAIRLDPENASLHNNLGLLLTDQRRLLEAMSCFHHALRIRPDYAEVYNHLGIVLAEQGKLEEASASYRQSLRLKPDYPGALHNLALALARQGKLSEAAESCRQALRLQPDFLAASLHLAHCLRGMGQRAEAVAVSRQALERAPGSFDVLNHLGMLEMDLKQFSDAENYFKEALRLKPDCLPVYNNLGIALLEQGRWQEAIVCYRQALHLKPDFVEALTNLGRAYAVHGQVDEAIVWYQRAVEASSDHPGALNNMANVCRDQGFLQEAVAYYRRAVAARPADAAVHSNLLFALAYLPGADRDEVFREHQEYGRRVEAAPMAITRKRPVGGRRLRIGYVSPDFRDHAVAFFLEPILAAHDHTAFEIFCYADVDRPDPVTRRLQGHADHWCSLVGMTHEQAAKIIVKDDIDLLIDLAGHTGGNRLPLFARKPAPVQATYLGYMGTTGLSAIDFRITDPYADPPGMTEGLHSEELVRLPETGLCFRPPESPEVSPLPAQQSGQLTFGSFNNMTKVSEEVVALWSRLLHAVPNSLLLIKTGAGERADERLRDTFARQNVSGERVVFLGKTRGRFEYLELYHRVDLCLDPFPYNGITTSCDALWMGVPVLTLAGQSTVSRQGVSLLTNVGLPELIAENPDAYVQAGASCAANLDRLARWRAELRPRMSRSPLTDAPRFVRHLEAAYRAMCARRMG